MQISQENKLEGIEKEILSVFLDTSKRPKITPRHESAIMIMLENDHSPGKVKGGLQRLEEVGIIASVKKKSRESRCGQILFSKSIQ